MKSFLSRAAAWVAVSVMLFSFAPKPGGDSYKVFLDNKLMTEQFVHVQKTTPTVTVSSEQTEFSVFYNHCGKLGTSRSVSLRDEKNNELKKWEFADNATMKISVTELMAFRKKTKSVNVYYASTEIPDGRLLVSLQLSGNTSTALN